MRLKPRSQRSRSSEEIISDVRERVHEAAPLVEIEFVQLLQDMLGDLEGNPEPIEVKIFGDDPDRLAELAEPVEEMLNKVDGVVDVVGMQRGNPEVTWTDRSGRGRPLRADRRSRCRTRWPATGSARWRPICGWPIARFPFACGCPTRSASIRTGCRSTLIRTADGKPIPVSEVATMERANGQGELLRENLRPMAVVSGRLEGRDLGSAVAEIQSEAATTLKLPIGYTYEIGGQYQSQGQAFRELLMVFALAVVLVFTILVDPVPRVAAGDPDPAGGAALARRRAAAAAGSPAPT